MKNLFIKSMIIVCIVVLYQGCLTDTEADSKSLVEQKFLFEVTYENYAWGFQLRGIYITNQGEVYQYNHSHEAWHPANTEFYTEEELLQKFESHKEFVQTVDDQTLLEMHSQIKTASKGSLSERVSRYEDAGITRYLAYLFESQTSTYKPVLLYQSGDWARKNLSQSAKVLYEWLFTLKDGGPGGCAP